jgi:hypothetical protein
MLSRVVAGVIVVTIAMTAAISAQESAVNRGATETSPSRSEYFSWINNTNEGATEAQTMVNLEFFRWLRDEYGLQLDIYAFDAGAIDGKRFYGSVDSERFRSQFPDGFAPIAASAAELGTRLGVWGGPDGFGETPAEEAARIDQMVGLCRDLDFALFKFDAVCGPLRPEKEHAFIRMMTECRRYSPDLILLNHRLGLERAQEHATTFLWEGRETYTDVFSTNRITAPHHRADALTRGIVPGMKRLTEDHGVCLSSGLDYWEDELVLQAFNRALILSPQIYGNPWLLRDDEFPRLARIFNLHRKYRELLVQGILLPEERFGPAAVSRGDGSTRLITLRNPGWTTVTYEIPLDGTIGLDAAETIHVRRFHPSERVMGSLAYGEVVEIEVAPFRSVLVFAGADGCDEPGVVGVDFEVIRNVPDRPTLIRLLGTPESGKAVTLAGGSRRFHSASIDGVEIPGFAAGQPLTLDSGRLDVSGMAPRRLADLEPVDIPGDSEALYEATVFAADNNALEVRALKRSGPTEIGEVAAAREAFFDQSVFRERGIWDRFLFDGVPATGFWPSHKYGIDQRVRGGCFRLDLGAVMQSGRLTLRSPDEYSLQPILRDEANWVEVSDDLQNWRRLRYMAGLTMEIELDGPVRYLRFPVTADRFNEVSGHQGGVELDRSQWRASNLFAHSAEMVPIAAWHASVEIEDHVPGGMLAIAVEGVHGIEGAYASARVDGKYVGAPERAGAYPSNTWEYVNARRDRGYTYYMPVTDDMVGKDVDVYVLGYDEDHTDLRPVVWHIQRPVPSKAPILELW